MCNISGRVSLKSFWFLISLITGIPAFSQIMVSPTGKPASLIICASGGNFSLQIANTTGSTMTGATLTIDLPTGALYVPGSVTGASEINITNLNVPVFLLPDIANNTAHTVSYISRIICGYSNNTNFNYSVSYNSNQYTGFDTPLLNYYYPEPVITQITNGTAVIPVNSTITRNINIEQQGLNSTLDTLIILDEHTSDIQVVSTNLGTLHPYSGPGPLIVDTIILTGADFPGGNNMFDAGETVIIGETVKLVGCINGASVIKASWGCIGSICDFYAAFPSVSPASGNPSVTMAFTANRKGWGFIDNSGWVEFTATNNGTGAGTAFDLTPLAGFSSGGSTYYPNSDWINEIDSFSVSGQYLPAQFNYAAGAINGQYAHFTALSYTTDPDGAGVGLDDVDGDGYFDDLPPGKTVTIKAHTYYDWPEAVSKFATNGTCGYGWTNSAYQAFRFGYIYQNQCQVSSGVNWITNSNVTPFMTYNTNNTQTDIPSDLYDNTPVWFEHSVVTTTSVNSEGCPNDSVVYKLVLPPGVIIATGYTATFKGVSMGTPQIIGDTVKYFLDKSRILSGGMFRVPVLADCDLPHANTGFIHAELKFWCDRINYKTRYFTYWCTNSAPFGIQCPVSNCPDPSVSVFRVERRTMGWTNDRCTTRVAPATPGIKLENAFAKDTIRIKLCGRIHGSTDSLFFQLQHNAIGGGWGNQLFFDFISDTLSFYDSETSSWHFCSGITPQIVNGTTSYLRIYLGDLTQPGNCLNGYQFSNGDSLVMLVYGSVKNIAQTEWRTVGGLRAEFNWKELNVIRKCNDLGYTFNVLGSNYSFYAGTYYQQIVLSGCTGFIYEGMIYRSLDICGGTIAFPGEVRPFCVLDTIIFTLPEGFLYQTGSSTHSYYKADGTQKTENIADPVITYPAGSTKITFIRDNTWGYPAYYDCNADHDRIRFTATPSCKVQGNYNYSMDARGRNQYYADGTGIHKTSTSSVAVTYTPPLMSLTPLIVTAEGREDTVLWKVRVCNSRSFTAGNVWLGFENISGKIDITGIRDISNPLAPVTMTLNGYGPGKIWIQAGNFNGSECRIYEIKAVYNSCSFDSIFIRHGYNCATFPLNPSLGYSPGSYSCNENSCYIYLDPKDVSLNLSITAPVNPLNLCDTLTYTSGVTNSQLSFGYDLKFTVTVPPGLTIIPGTSVFNYPYGSASWTSVQDPVNQPPGSNKWVYDLTSDPGATAFLKGVDSIPQNGYKLLFKVITDCNFTSGTSMKFTASASNACGDEKSRTSWTPPINIFGLPSNINLYVINTQVPGQLYTCSEPSLIRIKVINLGPGSVSQIEKLGFNLDGAFDYVTGSLVNVHNGPSGIASNSVIGGIRYINFAIEPNLGVNDSIVFTFLVQDINPAALQCDTIALETTTLLVADVDCQTVPGNSCLIQSITSSVLLNKPVVKDIVAFGSVTGQSIPAGISGEVMTINYFVKNNGSDTLHLSSLNVYFFYDRNNNEIPDETSSDSLFSQILIVPPLLPGDSLPASATFMVPSDKTCRVTGAVRLPFNGCICEDVAKHSGNIRLINAGPDTSVCINASTIIGTPAMPGYSYIWLPADYLTSNLVSMPGFLYPGVITEPDTLQYTLMTTRSGNCNSQDTVRVIINPRPSILNTDITDSICSGQTILFQPQTAYSSASYTWNATGSSPDVFGYSSGTGAAISQVLHNTGNVNEFVYYDVVPWYLGCDGDVKTFTATVHPLPQVSFSPSAQTICGNTRCSINLTSAVAGTTFTWTATGSSFLNGFSPGSGNIISQIINSTFYLPGQVIYTVLPEANSCQGQAAPVIVTVNPLPATDFHLCIDPVTTNTARPVLLRGGLPVGGYYSGNGVDSLTGIFSPASAGTGPKDLFYSYRNMYGCFKRDTLIINVVNDPFSGCGNILTDVRDGKTYKTIPFGSNCWMAEDLRYGNSISFSQHQRENCLPEMYCLSPSCQAGSGNLYQWDELMDYMTSEGSKGLCPPGWHVPAEADWLNLFSVYQNSGFAGSPLKYTGFSGFDALLPGAVFSNRNPDYTGWAGFYWSSTSLNTFRAWSYAMNTPDPSVASYPSRKMNAFSVRCVKD